MMNDSSRFAVYLIPPYLVSQQVMQIHQMLRKQFGLAAADRFQVHATVKGFFKKVEGPLDPLLDSLDAVFVEQRPFTVRSSGYRIDEIGIGYDCSFLDGRRNEELATFREKVVTAVRPFIAPNCDFAASDLGHPYEAHITLAFRDIRTSLYDDLLAYLAEAPAPTDPFVARTFHFLQFFSEDWTGQWWQTLTWRLIKSWHLQE